MGFLEERIKQAGKNRPVIRKAEPIGSCLPPSDGRGGGGGGLPVRGGKIVPQPASEYPALQRRLNDMGDQGHNAAAGDVNSLLQRLVA